MKRQEILRNIEVVVVMTCIIISMMVVVNKLGVFKPLQEANVEANNLQKEFNKDYNYTCVDTSITRVTYQEIAYLTVWVDRETMTNFVIIEDEELYYEIVRGLHISQSINANFEVSEQEVKNTYTGKVYKNIITKTYKEIENNE